MKYNPVPKMFAVFLVNENIMYWENNKARGKLLLINKVMVTNNNSKKMKCLIIKICTYVWNAMSK